MSQSQHDPLKVDVPVGFLLSEMREILVSVDRPYDAPLAIKLRLVPADSGLTPELAATPGQSATDDPAPAPRLPRRRSPDAEDDHDFGGCD
jgi:hypothetical protein